MNFDLQHCVPTKFLTEETFNLLIDKLVLEGYTLPSVYMSDLDNWGAFEYIGVTYHGDIILYCGSAWFYNSSGENSGRYPYVYSKLWLDNYLGGK